MTDFEDRLSLALRSADDRAPDAAGLASAARRRAGVRRRRTALTSVAAVLAVAGVVGGVTLAGGGDGGSSRVPAADDPTPTVTTSGTAPATRLESWRDLSVQVPVSWGYGFLTGYCQRDAPVVSRPEGASRLIGCGPYEQGYGMAFRDGALADLVYTSGHIWQYGWESQQQVKVYPEDSWLGYVRSPGDNLVWVVSEDRATVEEILGSVTFNEELDPLGCATRQGGDRGERQLPDDGVLRVCRYAIDGWLEQSEILTGDEAVDAVAAMEDAPAKGERMCTAMVEGPTIVLSAADAEGQVTLDACQGFSWAGKDYDLTEDVLYWALSPGWSGGVEGDVPMPTRLRQ